jgi:hypothetical protein
MTVKKNMTAATLAAQILLWLFVVALGVLLGGAIYEALVVTPLWAGAPPESVWGWNANPRYAIVPKNFWGVVSPLVTLLSLAAAVAGWAATPARRRWLVLSAGCFFVVTLSTILYFVPIIVALLVKNGAGLSAEEITTKAHNWVNYGWLRFALVVVSLLAALRALGMPPHAAPESKTVSILDEDELSQLAARPARSGGRRADSSRGVEPAGGARL